MYPFNSCSYVNVKLSTILTFWQFLWLFWAICWFLIITVSTNNVEFRIISFNIYFQFLRCISLVCHKIYVFSFWNDSFGWPSISFLYYLITISICTPYKIKDIISKEESKVLHVPNRLGNIQLTTFLLKAWK